MAKAFGQAAAKARMAELHSQIRQTLLPGAARAGAKVIAAEAKGTVKSSAVREAIVTKRPRRDDGRIVVTITVKRGWAYSVGEWLEWGTAPHFISVDDSQRQGMSIGKINKAAKDGKAGSLVIGGQFVGDTVFHPGARPYPFFRPALDRTEREAVAAAQAFINSRISKGGILPAASEGDEA